MGLIIRVLCPIDLRASDRVLWLVGAPSLPLTILSVLRCLHYDDEGSVPEFNDEADELRVLIPKGLEIVGAIVVSQGNRTEACKFAGEFALRLQDVLGQSVSSAEGAGLVAASAVSESRQIEYNLYAPGPSPELQALELAQDVENSRISLWTNLSLLRCQMDLTVPLYLPYSPTTADFERHLVEAVDSLMGDLKSARVVLLVQGSSEKTKRQGPVLIQPFNKLKIHETAQEVAEDLTKDSLQKPSLCSELSLPPSFFSTASGTQLPEPVDLTVMLQQSGLTDSKARAPVIHYVPAGKNRRTIQTLKLGMCVVCIGGSQLPLLDTVTDLILPALRDQLAAMRRATSKNAAYGTKVCAYHFCPPGWLHPVTGIYDLSKGELELGLVDARKALHRRLGLPLDRPMLRVANSVTFTNVDPKVYHAGGRRLNDVHVGLLKSGVSGGRQSLVNGSYEYYHYLQDRCDDNGWGCAYRSLQTIISWFRLQHYTTVPVPSHKDVQQTLVDVEDKAPSFVGSREWIGAVELSFVLDKLLGVSCKILNVRTGAEMPSYCRELALHFETQGTPVMIGGGVLAYTLLGVDYNELTGESAFLILDPHYTGGEDLKSIRNGGWCGWKRAITESGQPFFLQNKFYNLLLPQRPNTV